MILSAVGIILDLLWHQIPIHHKNIELGDFVVMPNHIHGILIIDKQLSPTSPTRSSSRSMSSPPTAKFEKPGSQRFQNIGKNTISSIVGSYKSAVTKHANRLGYPHQ